MANKPLIRLSVSVDPKTNQALAIAAGHENTSKTKHAAAILRKVLAVK